MWAALYTVTPELFPTKARGTGNGLASSANRVFGVMSPIIALYADLTVSFSIIPTIPMLISLRPDRSADIRVRCSFHLRRNSGITTPLRIARQGKSLIEKGGTTILHRNYRWTLLINHKSRVYSRTQFYN
jgi:hypothetical protein